jgi:CubicO group peptidase (beta-lactamase class C family)
VAEAQIVPEAWVAETTEFAEPVELEKYNGRSWGYRGGWWIIPRPEGPSDFSAIGRYGQFIYVSPQHDVVCIRTGPDRGDWGDFDWTELFYFAAERL